MQDKLDQKLELFKNQRLGNGIMIIIALLVLIFVPLVTFENLRFEFSIEWIIAFILLIVGIVRAITLNSKISELELDTKEYASSLNNYEENKPNINLNNNESYKKENFYCKYCNTKFLSEKNYKEHLSNCSAKKTADIYFITYCIYVFLIIVFCILLGIFQNKGMGYIFKWFIPISIIIFIGYVLYFEFYLRERITKWVK